MQGKQIACFCCSNHLNCLTHWTRKKSIFWKRQQYIASRFFKLAVVGQKRVLLIRRNQRVRSDKKNKEFKERKRKKSVGEKRKRRANNRGGGKGLRNQSVLRCYHGLWQCVMAPWGETERVAAWLLPLSWWQPALPAIAFQIFFIKFICCFPSVFHYTDSEATRKRQSSLKWHLQFFLISYAKMSWATPTRYYTSKYWILFTRRVNWNIHKSLWYWHRWAKIM